MTWNELMEMKADLARTWIDSANAEDLTEVWLEFMEDVWMDESGVELIEHLRVLHRGHATPFAKDTLENQRNTIHEHYEQFADDVE